MRKYIGPLVVGLMLGLALYCTAALNVYDGDTGSCSAVWIAY